MVVLSREKTRGGSPPPPPPPPSPSLITNRFPSVNRELARGWSRPLPVLVYHISSTQYCTRDPTQDLVDLPASTHHHHHPNKNIALIFFSLSLDRRFPSETFAWTPAMQVACARQFLHSTCMTRTPPTRQCMSANESAGGAHRISAAATQSKNRTNKRGGMMPLAFISCNCSC
jgi:hypothetical protein